MTRGEMARRFRNAWSALTGKAAAGGVAPAVVPGSGLSWPSMTTQTNPSLAFRSAAVWACCNLLSKAVATLPAQILEDTPSGKTPALGHALYSILSRSPNPMMTLQQWLQPTMLHLLLWGNAFTYVDRLGGEIIGLWPLLPYRMRIVYTSSQTVEYAYFDYRGAERRYTPGADMIPFRLFSLDGFIGLSVLQYQALTLDFTDTTGMYALNLYKNGGRPTGVLEYPNTLVESQINKIRASWASIHGGADGAGKVAVLDGGVKYSPVAIPPESLQFIETQKFSVEQIARIFGVPPHLIGAMDKPTYASVEQQSIEFSRYTLQPYVRALETSINAALLDPPYEYRLNLDAFERTDIRSRYGAYAIGRQWGWLSVNDIRRKEDETSIGGEGDIYLQPLNMVPAGTEITPAPAGVTIPAGGNE